MPQLSFRRSTRLSLGSKHIRRWWGKLTSCSCQGLSGEFRILTPAASSSLVWEWSRNTIQPRSDPRDQDPSLLVRLSQPLRPASVLRASVQCQWPYQREVHPPHHPAGEETSVSTDFSLVVITNTDFWLVVITNAYFWLVRWVCPDEGRPEPAAGQLHARRHELWEKLPVWHIWTRVPRCSNSEFLII